MKHVIIDFETLGDQYSGLVVSGAIGSFDPTDSQSIDEHMANVSFMQFNYKAEEQSNWVADQSTVDWWKNQPKEVIDKSLLITQNSKYIDDFLDEFASRYSGFNPKTDFIWSRGNTFDFAILDRMIKVSKKYSLNAKWFYNPFRVRDTRTIVDSIKIAMGETDNLNGYVNSMIPDKYSHLKHDPVFDVARDMYIIQQCWAALSE